VELFELHSRGCKKGSDLFENVYVASCGVAESWRINQDDVTAAQTKNIRGLYSACAGAKAGSADEIDELCKSRPGQGEFMSFHGNTPQSAGKEATVRETAYCGFATSHRTHNAIRPSGLTDCPRSMRNKGLVRAVGRK